MQSSTGVVKVISLACRYQGGLVLCLILSDVHATLCLRVIKNKNQPTKPKCPVPESVCQMCSGSLCLPNPPKSSHGSLP